MRQLHKSKVSLLFIAVMQIDVPTAPKVRPLAQPQIHHDFCRVRAEQGLDPTQHSMGTSQAFPTVCGLLGSALASSAHSRYRPLKQRALDSESNGLGVNLSSSLFRDCLFLKLTTYQISLVIALAHFIPTYPQGVNSLWMKNSRLREVK